MALVPPAFNRPSVVYTRRASGRTLPLSVLKFLTTNSCRSSVGGAACCAVTFVAGRRTKVRTMAMNIFMVTSESQHFLPFDFARGIPHTLPELALSAVRLTKRQIQGRTRRPASAGLQSPPKGGHYD